MVAVAAGGGIKGGEPYKCAAGSDTPLCRLLLGSQGRGGLKDASRSPPAPRALAGRFDLCLTPVNDALEAKWGVGVLSTALSALTVLALLATRASPNPTDGGHGLPWGPGWAGRRKPETRT